MILASKGRHSQGGIAADRHVDMLLDPATEDRSGRSTADPGLAGAAKVRTCFQRGLGLQFSDTAIAQHV